jgi:hypothetical protein
LTAAEEVPRERIQRVSTEVTADLALSPTESRGNRSSHLMRLRSHDRQPHASCAPLALAIQRCRTRQRLILQALAAAGARAAPLACGLLLL